MFSLLVFFSPDQFEKDNRWPIHQRHVLYSLDTGITRLACIATILRTFNRTVLTRTDTGCFVTLHVPISYTKRRMLDTCPRSSSFCFLNHGELLNRSPWAFFFCRASCTYNWRIHHQWIYSELSWLSVMCSKWHTALGIYTHIVNLLGITKHATSFHVRQKWKKSLSIQWPNYSFAYINLYSVDNRLCEQQLVGQEFAKSRVHFVGGDFPLIQASKVINMTSAVCPPPSMYRDMHCSYNSLTSFISPLHFCVPYIYRFL